MGFEFLNFEDEAAKYQQILACCLKNNSLVGELQPISKAMQEPFRSIAAGILQLSKKYGFVDLDSLVVFLETSKVKTDVLEVAKGLQGVPLNMERAKVYLETFQQDQKSAHLERLKARLLGSIQNANNIAALEKDFNSLLQESNRDEPDALLSNGLIDLVNYTRNLQVHSTGRDYLGFDSGFKNFNMTFNGVSAGLHVLAAVPGCGKSTFAWQLANQVASNKIPTVYVHFEQSKKDMLDKSLARMSGINSRHISRGRLNLDSSHNGLQVADVLKSYAKTIAPWTVVLEGDETTDVSEIERFFKEILKKLGAEKGLLLVDYLQMIPVSKDVGGLFSTMDKTSYNLSALRRIARNSNVPVVAISSMNRASYKSKSMASFKESGNIEFAADTASILFQEGGFCEKTRSKPLSLNVLKNRNGETARINFDFYPEVAKFVEKGFSSLDFESED